MKRSGLLRDQRDLLRALHQTRARYLVVGAHALALHGPVRATGDLDLWIEPASSNAERVFQALVAFGARVESHGLRPEDLAAPGLVYQIGVPPGRVDLMTSLTGLEFEDAWARRVEVRIAEIPIPHPGRADFVRNKRAIGRPKDRLDLELLGEGPDPDPR